MLCTRFWPMPDDFAQALGVVIDHVQRIRTELVDDALGHDAAHAADHARTQIAAMPSSVAGSDCSQNSAWN